MAMDSANYVSQSDDGRWMVVRNGQLQGYFDSQQQAEQMYTYLTEGGAGGSAYVPPQQQPAPSPPPYQSPSPSPSPYSGGGGGYNLVGGTGQYDSQQWQLQQEYLRLQLEEQRRQFDRQQEADAKRYGLSEQELAERRRQFDASQAEQTRQFNQGQGQQSEQYWAGLLGSLSGPRDWRKYQIAQSQMPQSARTDNMSVMDIARATPAYGAMTADPANSWEYAWANRGQGQAGAPGGTRPAPSFDPGSLGPGPTGGPTQQVDTAMNIVPTPGGMPPRGASMPVTGWQAGEPTYGGQGGQAAQLEQQRQRWAGMQGAPQGGGEFTGGIPLPKAGGGQFTGGIPLPKAGGGDSVSPIGLPIIGGRGGDTGGQRTGEPSLKPWLGKPMTQPNQISRSEYNRMSPTLRAMQEGEWSSEGVDPSDAWATMRKAFPQGRANTRTRWS